MIKAILITLALLCGSVVAAAQAPDNEKVRMLVVTGGGTYENTVFSMFDQLNDVKWTQATSDSEAFQEDFRDKYDVVLFFNIGRNLGNVQKTNLENFVNSGKGVIVLHHALASYNNWEWWYKEVVGGRYLLASDGDQPASKYRQGEQIVAIPTKDHPITKRLGGVAFHLFDETYKDLWISDDVEVLLRTGLSTADGPLVWVSPFKKSRVVVIQPGHSSGAHRNLGFRFVLQDSILWSANRLVEAN